MINLAIIDTRPNIYKVGIWKELYKSKSINSHVFFCCEDGVNDEFYDKTFNTYRRSDTWLLNDFSFSFPKDYSFFNNIFLRYINPTVFLGVLKGDFDIVLVQGYNHFMYVFSMIVARARGAKVIFRGEAVLRGNEHEFTIKNFIKKYYIKFIFKLSDAVMYSCSANKKYFQFYNVETYKLHPIPCAVDNKLYSSEYAKYSLETDFIKKELNINRQDFLIIFLARFTKRKRALDLLTAVSKIDHSNITILFVGDGPELENMKSFSNKNNIKTVYTGYKEQKQISKYYTIADLCVIVSDYDPSPKVMNEAMNFELPIIVTDVVGTAHDLVDDGHNGFIINHGELDSLSNKINDLNQNRDFNDLMGKNSANKIKNWSFEKDVYYLEKVAEKLVPLSK
jgi:glycosyltransferase involved in cell wall biosynthesis